MSKLNPETGRMRNVRRTWNQDEFDGHKPTVYDWVRLAAFIDGEGTVDVNTSAAKMARGCSYTVRVIIGNTNPNLILWLKQTFGGTVMLRNMNKYNKNWKNSYIWTAGSARAAWCLHNCMPWFLLKGAQAQLLVDLQWNIDGTRQGRGRAVDPDSVDLRKWIKAQLHELNAKGPSNQVVMTKEDFA